MLLLYILNYAVQTYSHNEGAPGLGEGMNERYRDFSLVGVDLFLVFDLFLLNY